MPTTHQIIATPADQGMTLDEIAAFVETAQRFGAVGSARPTAAVTFRGAGIKTMTIRVDEQGQQPPAGYDTAAEIGKPAEGPTAEFPIPGPDAAHWPSYDTDYPHEP